MFAFHLIIVVASGLVPLAATFSVSARSPVQPVQHQASGNKLFSSHNNDKATLAPNAALLTYLEINGWLLTTGGATILIDPILEGALDFNIPAIYSASKRKLPPTGLCEQLPPIDCLLITQGWDDHAHTRTLKKLANILNKDTCEVIAPPSARTALEQSGFVGSRFNNMNYIKPGSRVNNIGNNVTIKATTGALVGPPWQARENGYIIRTPSGPSVYIEPHVEYNLKELRDEAPVDAVITPISGQGLPAFELVHGPSDALRLVQALRPKYVVPMQNGDIDAEGMAASLVQSVGKPEEFCRMIQKAQRPDEKQIEVVETIPGEDILLQV